MRVALCRPVYDTIEFGAAESVIDFASNWRELAPPDQEWFQCAARGQPVDHVRNVITKRAIEELNADVLVWLDSDVEVPDPRDFGRLVQSLFDEAIDVGIMGVPVIKQESRGTPIMNVSMGSLTHRPDPTRPFEALAIGLGFVAVRAEVYRTFTPPYHQFQYDTAGNLSIGEDIGLSDRARSLGWRVMIEPRIEARHNFRRSHSLKDMNADQWNALTR